MMLLPLTILLAATAVPEAARKSATIEMTSAGDGRRRNFLLITASPDSVEDPSGPRFIAR